MLCDLRGLCVSLHAVLDQGLRLRLVSGPSTRRTLSGYDRAAGFFVGGVVGFIGEPPLFGAAAPGLPQTRMDNGQTNDYRSPVTPCSTRHYEVHYLPEFVLDFIH